MRGYLRHTLTIATAAMLLSCGESIAPEYGTLVVSPAMVAGDWNEIDSVRLFIQPGDIEAAFGASDTSLALDLELGIYNISVVALDSAGDTVYAGDTLEVLVEPYETVSLTIDLLPRYPWTAPIFADAADANVNNNGAYAIAWHGVATAAEYRLERDTSGSFDSPTTVYTGSDTTYACAGMTDGTYYYRVRAANDLGQSPWSDTIAFAVTLVDTLRIATGALTGGVVGIAYTDSICLSGGKAPFTWAIDSGGLPPGLDTAWGACLTVSGTVDSANEFAFVVSVTDSAIPQQQTSRRFAIAIVPAGQPLVIDTDSLPAGTLGVAYSAGVCASGGVPPYAWSLAGGNTPPGVDTNSSGCLNFAGIPTDTGTYACTVRVVDSDSAADTTERAFAVRIGPAPLRIDDLSVPACTASIAYAASAVALGGSGDVVWRVTGGALPSGLTLADSTADTLRIEGVATDTGSFALTLSVIDRFYSGMSDSVQVSLDVAPQPLLTVTGLPLPGGRIDIAYADTLCVAGGEPPYAWEIAQGALPTGFALTAADSDTACVALAGAPSVADTFAFVLRIADSHAPSLTVERPCTVVVLPPDLRIITADTLADAIVDSIYRTTLATSGGSGKVAWTLPTGQVPPGCSLSVSAATNSAAIEGMPTDTGTYAFTVAVVDSVYTDMVDTTTFVVRVTPNPLLRIVTDSLPSAFVNESYDTTVCVKGGVPPYDWTMAVGAMPQGIDFDFAYAQNECIGLVGMPIMEGTWDFTIRVTDSNVPQDTAYHAFSIAVGPARVKMLTEPPLASATRLESYYVGLESINGDESAHIWSVVDGALPPGLSLRDMGAAYWVIDGTPTDSGTYAFTLEVRDTTNDQSDTTAFVLTVLPGVVLRITTEAVRPGVVGQEYLAQLYATSTDTSLDWTWTWEWVSGELPAGITFVPDFGDGVSAVRGIPTAFGTHTFTVRTIDNNNPLVADTASFDLTIYDNRDLEITTSALEPCTVGTAYADSICVAGGTPPYTWEILSSNLPEGITVEERFTDNVCLGVAGTATASLFGHITVLVTDADPSQTQGAIARFMIYAQTP
ncbi:MAG: hypothetical protein GF331_07670 [Chitinivibrionales bacterium]|nr:hypothetical protein [Chitinivibrionales bacterium]